MTNKYLLYLLLILLFTSSAFALSSASVNYILFQSTNLTGTGTTNQVTYWTNSSNLGSTGYAYTSVALAGTCPAGFAVQNTTNSGVQCVNVSSSGGGAGTVTQIDSDGSLTGTPITTTGTLRVNISFLTDNFGNFSQLFPLIYNNITGLNNSLSGNKSGLGTIICSAGTVLQNITLLSGAPLGQCIADQNSGGGGSSTNNGSGIISSHYVDVANSGTSETILAAYIIPGNVSTSSGDVFISLDILNLTAGTSSKRVRAYLGNDTINGVLFYDSTAVTLSTSGFWTLSTSCIRSGASTARCGGALITEGASSAVYSMARDLTSSDWLQNQTLYITGTASGVGAASNDIVDKYGYLKKDGATGAGNITGNISSGYIPYASSTIHLINSVIFQDSNNIGIGTISPQNKLHQDSGSATTTIHQFTAGTTTGTTSTDGFSVGIAATGEAQIRQNENMNMTFITNSIERLKIKDDGNIGIGTTDPLNPLVISNGGAAGFEFTPSSGNLFGYNRVGGTYTPINIGGSTVTFNIAGTSKMTVAANGYVGIGDTTPGRPLVITSPANTNIGLGVKAMLTGGGNGADRMELGFGYNAGAGVINIPAVIGFLETSGTGQTKGDLYFATRDVTTDTAVTERMRVTSSGNIGIGTSTPLQLLDVNGSVNATYYYGDGSRLSNISAGSAGNGNITGNITQGYISYAYNSSQISNSNLFFSNENIGLGLTTPTRKLHQDSGVATANYHQFTANTTTGTTQTDGLQIGISAAGEGQIRHYNLFNLTFWTNNTERMRILENTTTILINKTTTDIRSALDVGGNVNATSFSGSGNNLIYDTYWSTPKRFVQSQEFLSTSLTDPWTPANIGGASIALISSRNSHQGIVNLSSTSNGVNTGYSFSIAATALTLRQNYFTQMVLLVQPKSSINITQIRAGFQDSITVARPTDGLYWNITSHNLTHSNFTAWAVNNSVAVFNATTYAGFSNEWYTASIYVVSPQLAVFELYNSTLNLVNTQELYLSIPTTIGRETGHGVVAYTSGNASTTNLGIAAIDYLIIGVNETQVR